VVGAGDKLEQRALTTERAIGDQWLVTSGLKAGDRLVVNGGQKARAGQTVQVLPYTAGPTAPMANAAAAAAAAAPATASPTSTKS